MSARQHCAAEANLDHITMPNVTNKYSYALLRGTASPCCPPTKSVVEYSKEMGRSSIPTSDSITAIGRNTPADSDGLEEDLNG